MGNFLIPLADRVAACQEMAKDPRIVITTFEKDLQTAFTAATLDFLRVRYPGTHFVWIMGADCLAQFHRWQQWQHIFETMPIAVVDRPAWRMKAAASTAAKTYSKFRIPELRAASLPGASTPAWSFITGPLSTLSSTQLRAARGLGAEPAANPLSRPAKTTKT
jgi:nicotinate-nucleotide adenylyltransferase